MKSKHIAAWALIGIGMYDLLLGQSSTPLPLLGNYLTQQLDAVLIIAGIALLVIV